MDETDLFNLFFSFRGISYIIGTGVLGIQTKVISDQREKINEYDANISHIEPLLRSIIDREDVPLDIKQLAQTTIEKIRQGDE